MPPRPAPHHRLSRHPDLLPLQVKATTAFAGHQHSVMAASPLLVAHPGAAVPAAAPLMPSKVATAHAFSIVLPDLRDRIATGTGTGTGSGTGTGVAIAEVRYNLGNLTWAASSGPAVAMAAPFVATAANLSLVVTVHDALGGAASWTAGHIVVTPTSPAQLRRQAQAYRARPTLRPWDLKAYAEVLCGLLHSPGAATDDATGLPATAPPSPALRGSVADFFAKVQRAVGAAAGDGAGVASARDDLDDVGHAVAKVLAFAGRHLPGPAVPVVQALVNRRLAAPLTAAVPPGAVPGPVLDDLQLSVTALHLWAVAAREGPGRATGRRAAAAQAVLDGSLPWVSRLLQLRMCRAAPPERLRAFAACADRAVPFPCARSRVFRGCLELRAREVRTSAAVDLRNVQVLLLEPDVPTASGGFVAGSAEFSAHCNPDRFRVWSPRPRRTPGPREVLEWPYSAGKGGGGVPHPPGPPHPREVA